MTNRWKHFRGWLLAISCCMLILGIIMVVRPQISAVTLCWLLGLLCVGMGAYEVVRYFKLGVVGLFFRLDLFLGIGNIILGILFLTNLTGAVTIFPVLVGLDLLVSSLFNIQLAVSLRRYKMGSWVTSLILGIVDIIFSIFLFADPFRGAATLMVFIGISLIVTSIQNFYTIACLNKAIKISEGPQVIETTWRSV